jgi:hypothetical protein
VVLVRRLTDDDEQVCAQSAAALAPMQLPLTLRIFLFFLNFFLVGVSGTYAF